MKIKIKGLKKAVGDYKRWNEEGYYSPHYGYLMFDKSDGELWTDGFYSLGRNSWNEYHNNDIINLGKLMANYEYEINMKNVKWFIANMI